jgi:autotransporter-associated beta strand protein
VAGGLLGIASTGSTGGSGRTIITDEGGGKSLTLVYGTLAVGIHEGTVGWVKDNAITSLSALNLGAGGYLQITSRGANFYEDRIADSIPINSYGGTFYNYNNVPVNTVTYNETVGTVSLVKGALNQKLTQVTSGITNVLTYSGLSQSGTATAMFTGGGLGNTGDLRDRLIITGQSTATIMGGWATVDGTGFASYDTTAYLGYAQGVYGNAGAAIANNTSDAAGIYNFNTAISAAANLTVGALLCTANGGRTLTLSANNLTIATGGLFFDNDANAHTISATSGKVMAGSGSDANLYVTVATATNQAGAKTISAEIANNGSGKLTLVKAGLGTLTASAANTYTGDTVINEGKLNLSTAGSISSSPLIEILYGGTLDVSSQSSTWTLGASQTLGGSGTLNGNATINGTVAPGVTGLPTSAGTLTVTGNLTFANNAVFAVDARNALLGGDKWQPGYDRMTVVGTVDLGSNAKLDVKLLAGETLALGDRLFIVDNDSTDAVSGLFKKPTGTVLNEGDTFAAGGKNFKIYYAADVATAAVTGGNDVALEVAPPPAKGTMILLR